MKYRSISNALRLRFNSVSETPLLRFRHDPETAASLRKDAVKPFIEYWKRPASLLALSDTAARKAMAGSLRFKNNADGILTDVAQDILLAFYELPEMDRPQSELDFEVWAYTTGKLFVHSKKYGSSRELSPSIEAIGGPESHNKGVGFETDAMDLWNIGSVYHYEKPHQLIHLEAKEALAAICKLPDDQKRFVFAIIDGGNVVDYAQDNSVSLFDAMRDLQSARAIMCRLSEDLADEKKEVALNIHERTK